MVFSSERSRVSNRKKYVFDRVRLLAKHHYKQSK